MTRVSHLAVAVGTLGLLSSIPATGQAPKLTPQQLNPPAIANKPMTTPVKPITMPNAVKSIAVPKASGTIALVPDRNGKRAPASDRMEQNYITYGPKLHAKAQHTYPDNSPKYPQLSPAGQCQWGC
jgi:hypothetical protein